MTNKTYYQAVMLEVSKGQFDQALWIKVNANMAGADEGERQARYIQLRARELSFKAAKTWVGSAFKGLVGLALLGILLAGFAMVQDDNRQNDEAAFQGAEAVARDAAQDLAARTVAINAAVTPANRNMYDRGLRWASSDCQKIKDFHESLNAKRRAGGPFLEDPWIGAAGTCATISKIWIQRDHEKAPLVTIK